MENKYGRITAERKTFHDGEPLFLLRSTDPLAALAIMAYAGLCQAAGCTAEHIGEVTAQAERVRQWQEDNGYLVKSLPD